MYGVFQSSGLKVLVIGGGGREHALVMKLAASPRVSRVYCAPGNAGTQALAENVPIPALAFDELVRFAAKSAIDLVVVGPATPLIRGIADAFAAAGIPVFGPGAAAARIEGSKVFSKAFMTRHGIPTAESRIFTDAAEAQAYVRAVWTSAGLVFKTDGLATSPDGSAVVESVVIADTLEQALGEIDRALTQGGYGEAGRQILIEERLVGPEASFIAFTDGKTWKALPAAQDHKPLFEGGVGPITEGMGAFAPASTITPELEDEIGCRIMDPTIRGLAEEGLGYPGVVYVGLMLTSSGPKVLEYNCRFGDPEAQVLLMGLKVDLVDVIDACLAGRLAEVDVRWDEGYYCCIVGASPGYPTEPILHLPLEGLELAARIPETTVLHANTRQDGSVLLTSGGRVVNAIARGDSLSDARQRAYEAIDQVRIEGQPALVRRDIGVFSARD